MRKLPSAAKKDLGRCLARALLPAGLRESHADKWIRAQRLAIVAQEPSHQLPQALPEKLAATSSEALAATMLVLLVVVV
eukprot:3008210-Amphidinium_carterae.1